MKRVFGKRWHRIPVALVSAVLVLMLLAGGVLAAFNVFMGNANVTVVEAFTISNTGGDNNEAYTGPNDNAVWAVSLYPGETKFLNVLVSNASPITVTIGTTGVGNNGVTASWSGASSVAGNSSIVLTLTVTAAGDTHPGGRTIYFAISRS